MPGYNTTGNRLALPTYKEFVRDVRISKHYGKESKKEEVERLQKEVKRLRQEMREKQVELQQKSKEKKKYGSRWEDYTTRVATLREQYKPGTPLFGDEKSEGTIENKDTKKVVKKLSLLW